MNLINALALEKPEGQLFKLCSCDYVVGNNEQHYPIELINSLQPSGMPLHKIILKVGAPIMLLRNLDIKNGLSNGTRLIVTKIGRRVLEAEIAVGANIGRKVFIPRIKLCPSDYPISFERIQFPVQLCFSMYINKAQGQSLQRFGVICRILFFHMDNYMLHFLEQTIQKISRF